MKSDAKTPEAYIKSLPKDRKTAVSQLREVILKNLPEGFEETVNYGMLGYVVPHEIYPDGYHCDPKQPLPFINLASQKNYIALYHMGLYTDPDLLDWFKESYAGLNLGKLDMGKSCIRFKKPGQIPYSLVGALCARMSPKEWIEKYEATIKNRPRTRKS